MPPGDAPAPLRSDSHRPGSTGAATVAASVAVGEPVGNDQGTCKPTPSPTPRLSQEMSLASDTDGGAPMATDDAAAKAPRQPRQVVGQPVPTPQPGAGVPAGAAEFSAASLAAGLAAGAGEVTVTNNYTEGVVTASASARSRPASPPRPADVQERAASEQVTQPHPRPR